MHYFIFSNFIKVILFNRFVIQITSYNNSYYMKSTKDNVFFLFFKENAEEVSFFGFNQGYPNFMFLFSSSFSTNIIIVSEYSLSAFRFFLNCIASLNL